MKIALSVITLGLCTALPLLAEEEAQATSKADSSAGSKQKKSSKTVVKPCRKCTHAPCRCGFSPSYYTDYCKPSRRLSSEVFGPVKPHWTRPRTETIEPTPRRPAAVPTREIKTTLGFDPGLAFRPPFAFDRRLSFRPTGALFGRDVEKKHGRDGRRHGRPDLDDRDLSEEQLLRLLRKRRAQSSDTNTLVPTPRRPRVVPAVKPKQSLGFDPSRSWSRSLYRGSRRGGHGRRSAHGR